MKRRIMNHRLWRIGLLLKYSQMIAAKQMPTRMRGPSGESMNFKILDIRQRRTE
jgi:hypothetical protein